MIGARVTTSIIISSGNTSCVRARVDIEWLQRDGAQLHYAVMMRDFLDETFARESVERSVRARDLTPPDF